MAFIKTFIQFVLVVGLFLATPSLCGKNRHDEGDTSDSDQPSAASQVGQISVEPEETNLNTGKDTQFKCTALNNTKVYWINANGSRIQDLNDTRISDGDGWLNVTDLRLEDAGTYTCLTTDNLHNATASLKVYEMPDYFLESMIVVAINVALAILFFSCLIYKTIQGRRETAKYKKYKEANVEITINDSKPNKPHNKHLDI